MTGSSALSAAVAKVDALATLLDSCTSVTTKRVVNAAYNKALTDLALLTGKAV